MPKPTFIYQGFIKINEEVVSLQDKNFVLPVRPFSVDNAVSPIDFFSNSQSKIFNIDSNSPSLNANRLIFNNLEPRFECIFETTPTPTVDVTITPTTETTPTPTTEATPTVDETPTPTMDVTPTPTLF